MLRGEIRLINLDPVIGSEANKVRPGVIVSNDRANRAAAQRGIGVITVVPVTTNVENVYTFQVRLTRKNSGLQRISKAQAEQVRSVDIRRIGPAVGRLTAAALRSLDEARRLHLDLSPTGPVTRRQRPVSRIKTDHSRRWSHV